MEPPDARLSSKSPSPNRPDDLGFHTHHIRSPDELTLPSVNGFYPCVIYALRRTSIVEKSMVIEALLAGSCRFFVCGGIECETWHDVADEIIVRQESEQNSAFEQSICTTWHENEGVEELFFFLESCTDVEDADPSVRGLILLIGGAEEEALTLFRRFMPASGDTDA